MEILTWKEVPLKEDERSEWWAPGLFATSVPESHIDYHGKSRYPEDRDEKTESVYFEGADPCIADWKEFTSYVRDNFPAAHSFYISQYRGRVNGFATFLQEMKHQLVMIETRSASDEHIKEIHAAQCPGSLVMIMGSNAEYQRLERKDGATLIVWTGMRWSHMEPKKIVRDETPHESDGSGLINLVGIGAQDQMLMGSAGVSLFRNVFGRR